MTYPLEVRQLAAALSVSSLAFWFFLAFPWDHHNESLMWALSLQQADLLDVFKLAPIGAVVGTYRPLGILLAWLTFHMTHGGIWLQQLVNFILTAVAWSLATAAARRPMLFGLVAFLCGFAYFPGYIYLFHLHGVFYGPLFIFLALLLLVDRDEPQLCAATCWRLFALTAVTTLFHTFALLLFCGYIAGLWLQNLMAARRPSTAAAVASVGLAGAVMMVMVLSSSATGGNSPWQGALASFRTLETNAPVMLLSGALAIVTAGSIGRSRGARLGAVLGAVGVTAALALLRLPVIWAWIAICLLSCLLSRRLGMAGLIGSTAVLPMATGTGSPTYALFVLMPCIAVTAWTPGIADSAAAARWLRPAASAVLFGTALIFLALLGGVPVPVLGKAAATLRAEQQKTQQLTEAFNWLDAHPAISGSLRLCQPGESPSTAADAIVRRYRAPTHGWAMEQYVRARYVGRLSRPQPQLLLCFGDQAMAGGSPVYVIPGAFAGAATIFSLPSPPGEGGTDR